METLLYTLLGAAGVVITGFGGYYLNNINMTLKSMADTLTGMRSDIATQNLRIEYVEKEIECLKKSLK